MEDAAQRGESAVALLVPPAAQLRFVADVQRGDIVVLRCPIDPSVDYIKRVVGLPGDEIAIEGGRIWVNGELFEEPWAVYPDARASFHTLVGDEHAFVLGDNRPRSSDSREFGSVPLALVRGKVELRVWPLARAGRI